MKIIIAGSRNWNASRSRIDEVIEEAGFGEPTEIISGGARGIDSSGEEYAKHWGIPLKVFKADWNKYRRAAGHIRNAKMAEYGDALIAMWDGRSRGTLNMINQMRKLGKPYYIAALGSAVLHDKVTGKIHKRH